ncbi:MAG TPA: hypothetical protein VNR18_13590 [Hyphomicrobiales bacterium]|nr:hypothetical protein [Hyphomicrobiales bacterium]
MKTLICKTARNLLVKSAVASLAATLSLDAIAQPTPADVEELVEYAQCIRANGYAEFPDPGPDGRMMVRITDPVAGERFRAAQGACTDKLPSQMAAMNAPMTPERLEGLVKFAECVRAAGLSDFPDPTPQGAFELSNPSFDLRAPQTQQTMSTCREANAVTGLMIRRVPQ